MELPSFWQQRWDADVVWCRRSANPPLAHQRRTADILGARWHEIDTGHYPEGIVVFKDLMSRDRGARGCGYQAHITDATMAMRSGNKDAIKGELENQLRVAAAFKASSHDKDAKQACANRSAALVTETAMAWHLEAIGSAGQRGTGDAKTMLLAAALYQRVVDSWTKQELASFQFPRLVKEDWPTLFKIKYAMADLLYSQKDWPKCGPAFDGVVLEDPTGPEASKASYAAGLCYQKVYEATHQENAGRRSAGNLRAPSDVTESITTRLAPRPMKAEQTAMVKAFVVLFTSVERGVTGAASAMEVTALLSSKTTASLEPKVLGVAPVQLPAVVASQFPLVAPVQLRVAGSPVTVSRMTVPTGARSNVCRVPVGRL